MPRINLSVPAALKAEMDQRPTMNWSRIAQEAFAAAIQRKRDEAAADVQLAAILTPLRERLGIEDRSLGALQMWRP